MSLLAREVVPSNVVNDQGQGALATIAAAIGLTTVVILLCIRLMMRWPWQSLFGWDDAAVLVATVFGVVHSIVILTEVQAGLGMKYAGLTAVSSDSVRKMIFASDILYVWTLFWSKLAVCFLIRRLSISRRQMRLANMLTYACAGLGVLSLLIIGIRQSTRNPWYGEPSTARSTLHRWIAVETLASSIDLTIAMVPFDLVWSLQMERSHKVWVILGFSARLPTIPLAVLRLISLSKSLASAELVFDYATTECFTQGEMCYSIISATIPCLRIFMHSAKTGLLGMPTFDSTGDRSKASYLGSRSGNFASTSRSQDRSKAKKRAIKVVDEDIIELQDRRLGETHTSAMAGSDKQSVTSDSSERAIIVRQTVDVVYT